MSIEALELPLTDIHADEDFNCRGSFDPNSVVDLARDIEKRGLIQPIIVQRYTEKEYTANEALRQYKYLLIAGYRRFMAHRLIFRATIQAVIREPMAPRDAMLMNLTENFHRSDLTILQEARALEKLRQLGIGEQMVAEKLGKSRGWVQVRYMLVKLPVPIQEEIVTHNVNQLQIRDIHTQYMADGPEGAVTALKAIKDAKIKGVKNPRIKSKDQNTKRIRNKAEIHEMIDKIIDNYGGVGIHTRCLAWAAGEVNDDEINLDLARHANGD